MNRSEPNFALPDGITEGDLVDLADGCLPPEREQVVREAIAADPKLERLIAAMGADGAALAQCAVVRAPAGMAEEIEARLETEALRGLAVASRGESNPIPISQVRVEGPGVVATLLESVWTRRLAMAAMIAVVGGGAVWGVLEIVKRATPSAEPVEVANTKPVHEEAPAVSPETQPIDVAVIDNAASVEMGLAPVIAMAETPSAMTEARAAALAREGKLVITIRTIAAQGAVKRLDVLARASGREGWRTVSMENVPAEYAALLTPTMMRPTPGVAMPGDRAIASDKPGVGPAPAPVAAASVRPVVKAIFTAEVNPGERWLAGLVRTISDALPEGTVLELREGATLGVGPAPVDPDSVMWWNGAPAKWAKKTTVPIVVEGLE